MSNQFMRLIVMFDLPITTVAHKKAYVRFRKFLLQDGYTMLQYSVYSRLCNGQDGIQKHLRRLTEHLPRSGSVRGLTLTEKQYTNMKVLVGQHTIHESIVKDHHVIDL